MVLFDTSYWQGLFDWITGTLEPRGMISPLDPELVTLTDDPEQAVAVATSTIPLTVATATVSHPARLCLAGADRSALDGDQQSGAGRGERGAEAFIRLHGVEQFAHGHGLVAAVGGIGHAAIGVGILQGHDVGEHDDAMLTQHP